MSRVSTTFACTLLALSLASCGQSTRRDRCPDDATACGEEGSQRCSRDGDGIDRCEEDDDGCLLWTSFDECGAGFECDDSGDEPTCECVNDCTDVGARQCSGDLIEECTEGEGGCTSWQTVVDCDATGERCDDSGAEPECVSGCDDECAVGDARCEGTWIVECEGDSAGCLIWQRQRDCRASGETCDDSGDEPECNATCTDECPAAGRTQCAGDTIQTCNDAGGGCLAWQDTTDCSSDGLVCEERVGETLCACPVVCDAGETRCDGTVVQGCMATATGCLDWVDGVDCATFSLPCDDAGEEAECLNGAGGDCSDPMVLWDFPSYVTGSSFSADFTDDMVFSHDSCESRADASEAVFAVEVADGGTIHMMEWGGVDIIFSVQSACDPAGACEISLDDFDRDGIFYDVPAAGTYYVIVETSTGGSEDYDIEISVILPEDCGDGVDNDLDGDVDCDDDDCFGDGTHCATETNCGDGEDNDADGDTDCDDSDCAASAWCQPIQGVWELFGDGDRPDVAGHTITFTPDAAVADGYGWTETGGLTALPVTPGSGTLTAGLTMSDDDFEAYDLTLFAGFPFYGETYTTLYVGSNGYVTFGGGSNAWNDHLDNHFALPCVSGLRADLDPTAGGTITVDELADRLVVTYEGVPRYGSPDPAGEPNTLQMVLHSDGTIDVHLTDVAVRSTLVGLSSGVGDPTYPDEVDYVAPVPEDCGDGVDNDFDGAVDCGDDDCFGDATHCATEALCEDGLDNDGDGDVDCDDSDCDGPECRPYLGYWERFETGDEPDVEGHSIVFTPDGTNPQGYSWALSPMSSTGFPVPPDSGLTTTDLVLGANDFEEYSFAHLTGFDFYGVTYTSVFVSSNGYVTFGAGSGTNANDPWDHFELPSVAGFRRDLYEVADDRLVVDELADRVVITYDDVPGYAGANDFQIVLHATGVIELHYVEIPVRYRVSGLVGISNGVGNGTWPAETDFVP